MVEDSGMYASQDEQDTGAQDNARNVSLLTRDTLALILAGGRGSRLHELTDWRAKPSLYFGGKFRIIDFALSNCLNSGIRRSACSLSTKRIRSFAIL